MSEPPSEAPLGALPPGPPPRVVETLDLDSLEPEVVHRLLLHLVDDGLGMPVRLPILVARGRREGPTVGITAALHGNELNGIPVIHRLFRRLDPSQLRGTLVGVVAVNVPGLLLHQRKFPSGIDLNHRFPGRADGRSADVYVYRVLHRIVKPLDVLVDLHTASVGRVNSLYIRADMTDPRTARMAYLCRPEIIVHNPPADMTLRGAAAELGIASITVEIGNPGRYQRDYIRRTRLGVRAILGDLGLLPKRPLKPGPDPMLCSSSRWLYTDRGGLLVVDPQLCDVVKKGECLATMRDAFGDVVCTYPSPEDGVIIGRSIDPVARTGARIVHLGTLAPQPNEFLAREILESST